MRLAQRAPTARGTQPFLGATPVDSATDSMRRKTAASRIAEPSEAQVRRTTRGLAGNNAQNRRKMEDPTLSTSTFIPLGQEDWPLRCGTSGSPSGGFRLVVAGHLWPPLFRPGFCRTISALPMTPQWSGTRSQPTASAASCGRPARSEDDRLAGLRPGPTSHGREGRWPCPARTARGLHHRRCPPTWHAHLGR